MAGQLGSTQPFILHWRRRKAERPKWIPVGSTNFRSSWVWQMWGQDRVKVSVKVSEGDEKVRRVS